MVAQIRMVRCWLLFAGLSVLSAACQAEETLAEMLGRVLPLAPQVRVQQGLVAAAEERVVQARSRFFPEFQYQLDRGRANSTELGFPIDRTTNRAQISLAHNVYNAGRDRAELEAVRLEFDAARQDLQHAREDVGERIATAYLELLRFDALQERAERRLLIARAMLARFAEQREAGKVSEADYLDASSVSTDAEIDLEDIRAAATQARAKLQRLTGESQLSLAGWPDGVLRSTTGAERVADDPVPSQTLAARLRADAAQTRTPPAWTSAMPRLDLRYDQALWDRTSPQLTDQLNQGWGMTLRWNFPLGGETTSRVNESQRRAEAALAEAERVQQGVVAELAGLAERIAAGERSLDLLHLRLGQFDKLIPAAELQYEAGRRSLVQLGQMYESRFAVERRVVEQEQQQRGLHLHRLALRGELLQALGLEVR